MKSIVANDIKQLIKCHPISFVGAHHRQVDKLNWCILKDFVISIALFILEFLKKFFSENMYPWNIARKDFKTTLWYAGPIIIESLPPFEMRMTLWCQIGKSDEWEKGNVSQTQFLHTHTFSMLIIEKSYKIMSQSCCAGQIQN